MTNHLESRTHSGGQAVPSSSTTNAPFRKVAVATDFTPTSDHALALASSIAKRCGAHLDVINVVEPAPYSQIGAGTVTLQTLARGTLDATLIRVRDDVPSADGVLLAGRPADKVLAFVEANAIDLVVAGTHGRTTAERWLVGSVAEKILRSSDAPVLIVHDRASELRRLLVATDLGPSSERALALAARLAATYGAHVTLLHVANADQATDASASAKARLEELARGIRAAGPECDVLWRQGRAWSAIAEETERASYDLVVVGGHDHDRLFQWLRGGVAAQVARAALPPVLSVRAATEGAPSS